MQQPVGDVLAGNPQCGAVFHQADVVDVGHFGAAHALFHPADDVAQDALAVVVQFLLFFRFRPVGVGGCGDGEQVVQIIGGRAGGQFALYVEYIDLMIVHGVQGGCGRRGHPCGGGTRFRMADFLFQHFRHQIGHRPHAFADLGFAGQAALQAGLDVAGFVSGNPFAGFHVAFAYHRARLHGGVHFVAGAVEEAGIDEDDAVGSRLDARGEVGRGAAFFVHDAHFQGVRRQFGQFFDGGKQFVGKADFFRAVHFGFDDVNAAAAAVFVFAAVQVERGDEGGHHAVQDAFGDFFAFGIQYGGRGHQVADVADEEQRAAGQGEAAAAVGFGVSAVCIQFAGEGFAAFFHFFGQCAVHQAEPVGVYQCFVLSVYGGHGVFAVHDGGKGGFKDDVFYAGRVLAAYRAVFVDEDVDVQAVVQEEERGGGFCLAVVADEEFGRLQAAFAAVFQFGFQTASFYAVGGYVAVAALRQRDALVEEVAGKGDDGVAAFRIVGFACGQIAALVDSVRAVQCVVQAAPAGIGGIEGVAGVVDGDDQLGARLLGHFPIDVLRADFKRCGFVG